MKSMKTKGTKGTKHISRRFRRFLRANEAISALEYALLIGVIATTITGALVAFGTEIETALTDIQAKVTSAVTSATN